MRPRRLGVFSALCAVLVAGGVTTAAAATVSPSATALQTIVGAPPPSAIACGGFVDVQAKVTGHAGTSGSATDVMLVLDLSGSMNLPTSKFGDLKRAALDVLDALNTADGLAGNRVGIVAYNGESTTVAAPIGSTLATLQGVVNGLSLPAGGSPHSTAINLASTTLSGSTTPPGSTNAKAMVPITDGVGDDAAALTAASNAKSGGVRIVPIGIGTDANKTALENWASATSYYQSGTGSPDPIIKAKLVADLGAAVSVPASFSLTETLGAKFAATSASATAGTVTPGAGTLLWTGTLGESQTATLNFRTTRNGSDVFAVTNEVASTISSFTVTGGTATITPPASISIDVLPCGGNLLDTKTCTGASCTASGSQGGVQYALDVGTPPAGTSVFLTGLNAAPPAGVCPGFDSKSNGVEFDVRPLTTDATFQMVIPKAALGSKKWWQTDVCIGTNMKFTTAIESLANLRPGAKQAGGGTLPGRWWGLLPSVPRYVLIPGLGWVRGPYITSRSQDAAGNAVIKFTIPYIPGSEAFTTDGKAAYDPKCWG